MKKWDDIKHIGMTPKQIKAAKKRVLRLVAKVRGEKKTKKEARGGHHGS